MDQQTKKKLLGYYDYTVVLTYAGMLAAFYGILKAINLDFKGSVFCLMIAGICDMFDGAVASTKGNRDINQKNFGIQIDSLSDLISFGVLPGLFVYMISGKIMMVGAISGLFTLCALIRLAYFNILEEQRQKETSEKRKCYLGVPVTTIALLLPLAYLLYESKYINSHVIFSILLVVTAIGFVLPLNIKKPQKTGKIIMIILGLAELASVIIWG